MVEGTAKDTTQSIVQVLLEQIGSQVDLATTLATAIAGGVMALIIQFALRDRKGSGKFLVLRWYPLLGVAVFLQGTSLVFGYFARSAITAVTPILMLLPPDQWFTQTAQGQLAKRFTDVQFDGSGMLGLMVMFQFFSMFAGLALVFVVVVRNLSSLRGD